MNANEFNGFRMYLESIIGPLRIIKVVMACKEIVSFRLIFSARKLRLINIFSTPSNNLRIFEAPCRERDIHAPRLHPHVVKRFGRVTNSQKVLYHLISLEFYGSQNAAKFQGT
jgi:hypothetical protein